MGCHKLVAANRIVCIERDFIMPRAHANNNRCFIKLNIPPAEYRLMDKPLGIEHERLLYPLAPRGYKYNAVFNDGS